jgi:epoxide hydrolase
LLALVPTLQEAPAGAADEDRTKTTTEAVAISWRHHHPPTRATAGLVDGWSEFKSGGHFPAMEASELLVGDVRKFFHDLR